MANDNSDDDRESSDKRKKSPAAVGGLKDILRRARRAAGRRKAQAPAGEIVRPYEKTYIIYPSGGVPYPAGTTVVAPPLMPEKKEEHEEEAKKPPLPEGIQIAARRPGAMSGKVSEEWQEKSKSAISETYPLVVRYPTGPVFAYAQVYWDTAEQVMAYGVVEPQMGPDEWAVLNKIKEKLEEKLDVDFTAFGKDAQENYLRSHFAGIVDLFNIQLSEEKKLKFE